MEKACRDVVADTTKITSDLMSEAEDDLKWYVVRTQPKRERVAAGSLRENLAIEVLCPLVRYRKATRRGKVWWSEAMFPGYIFARFNRAEHERAVRYAQGILTLVQFGEYMPSVSESFIKGMLDGLGEAEEMTLSHTVELGEQYEIASGPLQGQTGNVIEVLPGKERVRLLIEFIGGEHTIDVDLMSLLLPGRPDTDR